MIYLEKRRIEKGWSKRELSRRSSIDASIISCAERQGFRPFPGQLEKLAEALGVPSEQKEDLIKEVNNDDEPKESSAER